MRSRLLVTVSVASLLGAGACHKIAGLEAPVDEGDGGAGDAVSDAPVAMSDAGADTWCTTQPDEVANGRGVLVYCNDFDRDSKLFGFGHVTGTPDELFDFSLDPYASSSPNSMLVRLMPAPDLSKKPIRVASRGIAAGADQITLTFDLSFGPEVPLPPGATESPATMGGIRFADGRVIVFGVHRNDTVIAYVSNLEDIKISELTALGQRLGGSLVFSHAFRTLEIRIRRASKSPCTGSAVQTKYIGPPGEEPDGGDPLYVASYAIGTSVPERCALLPNVDPGNTAELLLGGFIAHPDAGNEWRFDNVAVRAMPR